MENQETPEAVKVPRHQRVRTTKPYSERPAWAHQYEQGIASQSLEDLKDYLEEILPSDASYLVVENRHRHLRYQSYFWIPADGSVTTLEV